MSKTHETIRVIDGVRYRCRDIGCNDFDRAEYNRFIVANNLFSDFYRQMEDWFTHTPLNSPLPIWMPVGELPYVSGGERLGFQEAV